MSASTGIVNIARLARCPSVPITYATIAGECSRPGTAFISPGHSATASTCGVTDQFAEQLDHGELECARRPVETRVVEIVCEAERRVGHRSALPAATDAIEPRAALRAVDAASA